MDDDVTLAGAGSLVERFFGAALGTLELMTVHLGTELGLYDALGTAATTGELSARTGVLERYAREWCEQQAVCGLLSVDDPAAAPAQRVYSLPAATSLALVDPGSLFYVGPVVRLVAGAAASLPAVLDAWREGRGMSFAEYGDDVRLGQAGLNRPGFEQALVQEWIPAMPHVAAIVERDGATVVDVGCGTGWSSIALAKGYPHLRVLGIDSDEASVMDGRENAAAAGVADRVRFEVASASSPLAATYDVAFVLEALHDLAHPVQTLRVLREALRPGGRVVVMDDRTEDAFAPDGPPTERLLYAASVVHCLPVGLSEPDSAGTGAVMRPETLRRYAADAGFSEVRLPAIEHDMMRFYELLP